MDVETGRAIDALSSRIQALEVSVNTLDVSVNTRIDAVETRIDSVEASLRAEMRAGFDESRRHTQMLFESLRDDIQLLAEGFAHLSARLK